VSWTSIVANIILFGVKYWAGIVSGSVAIIADAWHTLSDSISSIFVLVGNKVSKKPPDERHPFGHGRAELITTILIGMLLAFVAYELAHQAIAKFTRQDAARYGPIALTVTILSLVVKEGLAQLAFWAGRRIKSHTLHADGWHHRSDAISSLLILLGVFLGRFFWWIDAVLGVIVSVMIFYTAVTIIRSSIDPLMGKKPDQALVNEIITLCNQIAGFAIKAHHFHIHQYGDHTELTFHIVFPPDYTLKVAHHLTNQIEESIRKEYNIEATIHMEPEGKQKDFHPEEE